jgi:hypothetical protein
MEDRRKTYEERQSRVLKSIREKLELAKQCYGGGADPGGGEDSFYRYYHGSFKVYSLQSKTVKMVEVLREIGRDAGVDSLNAEFQEIISHGTGKTWNPECNLDWGRQERPVLEAFFHAREMLRLVIKYGEDLKEAPSTLPSGWAAVLYLYNSR